MFPRTECPHCGSRLSVAGDDEGRFCVRCRRWNDLPRPEKPPWRALPDTDEAPGITPPWFAVLPGRVELLPVWRSRQDRLRESLRRDDADSWLARSRAKVLRFLIARSGGRRRWFPRHPRPGAAPTPPGPPPGPVQTRRPRLALRWLLRDIHRNQRRP